MATTSGVFSSFPTFLTYRVTADEISTSIPGNSSVVRVTAFIDCSTTFASSSGGSGTTTAASFAIGAINFSGPGTVQVNQTDVTVPHNPDGSGSYSFSGTASCAGWGTASTGTGTLTLTTLNLSAGKRWTGSAWVAATVNKRWNGSAWVDLTIKRRWSGSAWVDLS